MQEYVATAHQLVDQLEAAARAAGKEGGPPSPADLPQFDLLAHPANWRLGQSFLADASVQQLVGAVGGRRAAGARSIQAASTTQAPHPCGLIISVCLPGPNLGCALVFPPGRLPTGGPGPDDQPGAPPPQD